jgi:hypothetical protein
MQDKYTRIKQADLQLFQAREMASAAESEVGACFHKAQIGAPLRVTLTELGHTQPPTPLLTYNSTAYGIVNETIK